MGILGINDCYWVPLRINSIPIERIDTLQKFSKGWLYNSDVIRFFFFFGGEHIPPHMLEKYIPLI